jgi:hypothetical protein
MSRAPHEPTDKIRAEIIALKSYGIPVKEIARYVGIDDKTMAKYYRKEMDEAAVKASAAVGKFLFEAASGAALSKGATYSDCLRGSMFWAKTRMGWRENDREELPGDAADRVIEIIRSVKPKDEAAE